MKMTPRVKRIIQFIEKLTVPSGKGEGKPFKLRPFQRRFINDVYGQVNGAGQRRVRRAILSMARKNGKGLALDTPLPTPSGWATMGDLSIGDNLYDEQGNQCTVTMVSDIRNIDCYEVEFSNGEKIVCDGDHLWETTARVNDPGSISDYPRKRGKEKQVRDTRRLFETQVYGKRKDRNHSIDMPLPIRCDTKELPIDPYIFGVWLGDGNSRTASISCGDEDIDEMERNIRSRSIDIKIKRDRTAWRILLSSGRHGKRSDKIQTHLREMGVLQNKHIPEIYLRSSINQRVDLLRGLMDTDGTCDKQGRAQEICTIKRPLADGICELLASLGIKYSVREKELRCNGESVPGTGYYIQFCCLKDKLQVFTIARKLLRQKSSTDRIILSRSRTVQIVSVKKVNSVPTKCIQVDSSSKLFLCGRTMIPTHNSVLIATLALVHLVGPEAVKNGEIYSAANDREQAALIFKYAAQIVRAEPELVGIIKIVDSTKTMVCYANGSVYRAVSAEAGTKFGLNPTVVIYDELAQSKQRDLYDALDTSMAAREEPLFIVISTQSNDPQHILSQLIDDGLRGHDPTTICHLYAVPDDDEEVFTDKKIWKLANPALGDFRSLSEMRTAAKRAVRMPSFESSFRNLYLNQRVDAQSPLIPRLSWTACNGDAAIAPGSEIYVGLDLSGTTDLTAMIAVSTGEKDRVKAWFWKPEQTLRDHEKRDRVPYWAWKQAGYLETTPGSAVDYDFVAFRLGELKRDYVIKGLAFDRWAMKYLVRALGDSGIDCYTDEKEARAGALRLVDWGQGYATMNGAVVALETSVLEKKLVHDGHPVLTWNISNAMAISDPAGNRKLDKSKTRFRIDGAVALAMAIGLKYKDTMQAPEPSVYEGMTAQEIKARMAF